MSRGKNRIDEPSDGRDFANGGASFVRLISSYKERLIWEINALGADIYALPLWEKSFPLSIKLLDVTPPEANIIKQEALSAGIDAAVHKLTITGKPERANLLILGSLRGVKILAERLKRQGFKLPRLAEGIEALIETVKNPPIPVLKMRGRALTLTTPKVMGILNVTPDSFSDGGKYLTPKAQEARVREIFESGADFVDVGGVSTRPGFTPIDTDEELARVLPAVELAVDLAKKHSRFVSVDTVNAAVAEEALKRGCDMINDQSALSGERMGELIAESGAGVCLMYTPPDDGYLKESVFENLNRTKEACIRYIERALSFGIEKNALVIDPGFGFGKTVTEGFAALAYLDEFCALGVPLLAGISRKSMLTRALPQPAEKRGAATTAAETIALLNGAKIIRTHDVDSAVDAVRIAEAVSFRSKQV